MANARSRHKDGRLESLPYKVTDLIVCGCYFTASAFGIAFTAVASIRQDSLACQR